MSNRMKLNDGWHFVYGCQTEKEALGSRDWQSVSIPHTWNNLDGQDGGNDYLRGKGWYRLNLHLEKNADKVYYLEFLGAASVCDVFVNGKFVGQHRGGYTLFRFNITDALVKGNNEFLVCADNSPFADVIPLTADFTFFGGIYRDVNLVESEKTHFSLNDSGSDGIRLGYENSPAVEKNVKLNILAKISGSCEGCLVRVQVFEPEIFEPCRGINKPDFKESGIVANEKSPVAEIFGEVDGGEFNSSLLIEKPHLWNGRKDPFCYNIICTLCNDEKELDRVEKRVGFRYFHIDSRKGFFLNGSSYPLRGVNRHQDRKNMGWAISEKEHEEDFALIYEMGANAVRLAHYPHHPHFYDLCDKYGLLVWAEIPFVDRAGGLGISGLPTDPVADSNVQKSFLENAKQQLTELIVQQCHRPSIFCWSVSNEVMAEFGKTAEYMMSQLDSLVHSLDSERYSAIATNHTKSYKWKADIRGCNIYPGWYGGKASHFKYQSQYHMRANRLRGVAVSEYGAGSNVFQHTENPVQPENTVCDFHPEEWASIVHENALKLFMKKSSNKIWGTFVWNMFDFAVDSRNEGSMPGMNDKGLVTYDRKIKKDAFYLYKSYWSRDSVVYITSRRFEKREQRIITVKVYSNAPAVSLYINGHKLKTIRNEQNRQSHIFLFEDVSLRDGDNTVTAKIYGGEDSVVWKY